MIEEPTEKGSTMGTTVDVGIDQKKSAEVKEPVAEIFLDEFQEARRDPRVKDFLADSRAYGKKLDHDGRIHRRPER